MTNKELTSLAIRVFAIYILLQAVLILSQSFMGASVFIQGNNQWILIIPFASALGLIILFLGLWKLSNLVINKINSDTDKILNDTYKVDQVFILTLMGFYLSLDATLASAQDGFSLLSLYSQHDGSIQNFITAQNAIPHTIFHLVGNLIKLLLGITLIIKPYGWTRVVNHFRNFGMRNK